MISVESVLAHQNGGKSYCEGCSLFSRRARIVGLQFCSSTSPHQSRNRVRLLSVGLKIAILVGIANSDDTFEIKVIGENRRILRI